MKTTSPLEHAMPYIPTSASIVRANQRQTIRMDLRLLQSSVPSFKAILSPVDSPMACAKEYLLQNADEPIELELAFGQEQEYIFLLYEDQKPIAKAFFYALEDDLFGALPMKADFHMHSTCSDGDIAYEKVAACCRRVGLDLMALTDHHQYEPSQKVIELYRDIPHEMLICPGEEVHSPNNPVHIVNLNGQHSVNRLFEDDPDTYFEEVTAIEKTIQREELNPAERFSVAASIWVAQKIKECHGLAVFCHPYWLYIRSHDMLQNPLTQTKYISDAVEDSIWQSGAFDCVEMIGGFGLVEEHYDNNLRSVISYYEHIAKGYHLNPVGTSDCHRWADDERMGWYYTIAFVRDWSADGFVEAVRRGHCVAVEDYVTQFTGARAYGKLRLVRYAQFLQRMVYPTHNALCREESLWMSEALAGNQEAIEKLRKARGRVQQYLASCFASR